MKVETIAKNLHDNIEKDINGIHPWQYQNFELKSINYEVILEDIETYWTQEARFREGFKIEENTIYVPNFFTKINGIHKNEKDYKTFIQNLKNSKNTLIIDKEINFYNVLDELNKYTNKSEKFLYSKQDYIDFIEDNINKKENIEIIYNEISVKNILKHLFLGYSIEPNKYTFDYLTSSKQKQIVSIIKRYIENEDLNKKDMEKFISICFTLPEKIINLINNFDYSYDIPKIVYIKEDINKEMTLLLRLLNELAFDIIMLSPSGKSNIEKYIDINELSLGYFVDNYNIALNIISDKERKNIKSKEKRKKCKKVLSNIFDKTISVIPDIILDTICIFFIVSSVIAAFIAPLSMYNTLYEIIVCFILCLIIYFLDNETDILYNEKMAVVIFISMIAVTFILLFGRFMYWGLTIDSIPSSHTHEGYVKIEEEPIIGNDDFVISYKKDAIGQEDTNTVYCYFENNSINKTPCYLKLFVGNTQIYTSGPINPLSYIPKIYLDNKLPAGDTTVRVEYYIYDEETETFTDNLLGSGELIIHIYETNKEYRQAKEDYQLNICSHN